MSVINQMLRDLDARGQGAGSARAAAMAAAGQSVRATDHRKVSSARLRWALVVVTLMLAGVVAGLVWTRMQRVTALEADAATAPDPVGVPSLAVNAPAPIAPMSAPAPVVASTPASTRPIVPEPSLSVAASPLPETPVERARPARASIERIATPPSVDPLVAARSALEDGRLTEALGALESSGDASAEGDALRAAALQQLGRTTDAIEAYRRALRREPDIGAWWAGLGISLESEGRGAEALDAFREAQRRGPLDPALADYLGERVEALSAGEPSR